MSAPSFALPAPDPLDQRAVPAPIVLLGPERARAVAAAGALGATAVAATLAIASAVAVFEYDAVTVVARPASLAADITMQAAPDPPQAVARSTIRPTS